MDYPGQTHSYDDSIPAYLRERIDCQCRVCRCGAVAPRVVVDRNWNNLDESLWDAFRNHQNIPTLLGIRFPCTG